MDPSSRESLSDAEMKLSTHREEVETVIDSLAVEGSIRFTQMPDSDKGLLWIFKYGTIRVYVAITGETDDDTLTVWAPVLKMPATPEKEGDLYRFLLERNWLETWESRFCIRNDEVVLLSMRTLDSIDPGEISRAITIVATLADEYDESLLEQFGGQAP
ncbi:MAG: YbjN domain-containing protein [Gemmatimonadaceae bacterium]|nr:YbjN domain-containing protein [Gloeobacterales cyanobacterium ES-bin-141]